MSRLATVRLAADAFLAVRGGTAAIRHRQQARLDDLVAYARRHSPFYEQHLRGLPNAIADLQQLPPVAKDVLMRQFEDWVTDRAIDRASLAAFLGDANRVGERYLDRYLAWTTSGSTGTPAIILHDETALAIYRALSDVRQMLAWLHPKQVARLAREGRRSATLLATGGHYAGASLVEDRRQTGRRRSESRLFSVMTPLPDLVEALNGFQPTLLASYPTALALLAREQRAGRLRIRPVLCSAVGEWLADTVRTEIVDAFGAPVRDVYSASETATIAVDCGRGWLHVNADWIILEPVDEACRPVAAGQPSRSVLVTNLANRVQPIIRYDLGDSVVVNPSRCSCGSPLPAIRVEGRTDDVLHLPTASGALRPVLPQAIAPIVEATAGVRQYQIVQTDLARLVIRLDEEPGADRERVWSAIQANLDRFLTAQQIAGVEVQRASERPRRDPRSGKFRQVWSVCDSDGRATPLLDAFSPARGVARDAD